MRHWEAPQQADILVSELLGSFGDNELSPECLDGAQKFLKEGGISIPQSYTSFLQPITTAKLWNDVKVSLSHGSVHQMTQELLSLADKCHGRKHDHFMSELVSIYHHGPADKCHVRKHDHFVSELVSIYLHGPAEHVRM